MYIKGVSGVRCVFTVFVIVSAVRYALRMANSFWAGEEGCLNLAAKAWTSSRSIWVATLVTSLISSVIEDDVALGAELGVVVASGIGGNCRPTAAWGFRGYG